MSRSWSFLLLFVVGLALVSGVAQGQVEADAAAAFYRGRELAKEQKYVEAIAAFEAALTGDRANVELLYNLGTVCLFAGENGKGLYYLRLAEQLEPNNEDVAKNLSVARDRATGEVPVAKANPFVAMLLWPHRKTTAVQAFGLFAGLYLLGMLALHLRVFRNQAAFKWLAILCFVGAAAFMVSAWTRRAAEPQEGVILDAEIDVFSAMSEEKHLFYFHLHAASEVEVLEDLGDWVKIAVDDRKGYVRREVIGLL